MTGDRSNDVKEYVTGNFIMGLPVLPVVYIVVQIAPNPIRPVLNWVSLTRSFFHFRDKIRVEISELFYICVVFFFAQESRKLAGGSSSSSRSP